nr:hypothetical protein [Tanacetum cinerariifolium]
MKNKKVDKISYPRYTKLIIAHFISRNNEIPKRSNADMHSEAHDELMQKESSAYKMYLTKIRKLAILMDQPKTVEPTKGTNRKPSASMVRGATKKIVVKQKKNVTFAESLTGYEDDDVRIAKLVSSVEEKPDGDSFDIERLIVEPKTDEVPEVTMTKPTGLPQGGTTGLKYVLITPEATPTFVLTPGEI